MRQFEPFCIYRNKETGERSHRLLDVAPRKLTVDPGYKQQVYNSTGDTLFREVEIVPAEETLGAGALALMDLEAGTWQTNREAFFEAAVKTIEQAIENNWLPGKFHLVFHSSGYDSRILSALIHKLYRKNGEDWLGDTLFVCLGPESPCFVKIMECEDWEKKWYLALPDATGVIERMFDTAREWVNGTVLQALDYNWILVDELQRMGRVPEDDQIQLWSGRNETLMGATMPGGNRLREWWHVAYDAFLSASIYKAGEVVFPLTSYDLIRLAIASSVRFHFSTLRYEQQSRFRQGILECINPELARCTRIDTKYPPLSNELLDRILAGYEASWYGCNVKPDATLHAVRSVLGYYEWWGHWSAAVLCEKLLEEGHELTIG